MKGWLRDLQDLHIIILFDSILKHYCFLQEYCHQVAVAKNNISLYFALSSISALSRGAG
jgi:hypothetical protein